MKSSVPLTDLSRFLRRELQLLSLGAALSTRAKQYPVYDRSKSYYQRASAQAAVRQQLVMVERVYGRTVKEIEHIKLIERVAKSLSATHGADFHGSRFRFGVAQKLVNVHLKYLWSAGLIPEPPHCPIDGIIRDAAKLAYDWVSSDSIDDYRLAIAQLRAMAAKSGVSLAAWELSKFGRRRDLL